MSEGREKDAPRATPTHAQAERPPAARSAAAEAHKAVQAAAHVWTVKITHADGTETTASAALLDYALEFAKREALRAARLRRFSLPAEGGGR